MNAARPVPHAVEIPGEVVRPEEVLAEVRLGWMNEDRAVIAVIAVMAATSEGSLLGESSGVAIPSDGSPPEVGLVITRDQSVELASDLWTLQHAGVGILAVDDRQVLHAADRHEYALRRAACQQQPAEVVERCRYGDLHTPGLVRPEKCLG